MKKFIALTLAFASLSSMAATTGTLLLKGTVAPKLSVDVTPTTAASALNLEVSQTDLKVGEVRERSNSSTGYKLTISSANAGKLQRGAVATDFLAYTMKYNGSAVNLASPVTQTNPSPASVNAVKDVTISYTGVPAENMVAGDYTDTITFVIAAN